MMVSMSARKELKLSTLALIKDKWSCSKSQQTYRQGSITHRSMDQNHKKEGSNCIETECTTSCKQMES